MSTVVPRVLADLAEPKLLLDCKKCGLRRRYDVEALFNKVGNARLPELVVALAKANGCSRAIGPPHPTLADNCGLRVSPPPV